MRLRDLVSLRQLDLTVKAYEEGLDRRIRWVHTTELADASRYLQGGELILTTGLWRRRRGDDDRFVSVLARTGVCGLVYGLPKPGARTPAKLIEACRRHELPLLEASFDLPFISISKAVIDHFTDERQAALMSAIQRNEQLVNAMLEGNGGAGVVSVLARNRSLRPWLLNADGQVVASGAAPPGATDARSAWRAISAATRYPADIVFPGGGRGSAFPVLDNRPEDGFLVVRKSQGELTRNERAAIDQALAFLRIESVRMDAIRAIEGRFARELLDLIEAGESHASEIAARLRSFDLDPDGPLVAIVVLSSAEVLERARVAESIERFFALRNTPVVVATKDAEAVTICGHPASQLQVGRLGNQLAESLQETMATNPLVIGIGAPVQGAGALRRSLVEAQQAARLSARAPESSRVTTYEQLASYKLLLALQEEELRETFYVALLGPISDYDARRHTELLHTLDVFLATGGHWQTSARRLNIHVNTLRYRLARIEALTGRNLDSMESRVDFFLALRAGEAGGNKQGTLRDVRRVT
jgi:sugar diacid utilization regulator